MQSVAAAAAAAAVAEELADSEPGAMEGGGVVVAVAAVDNGAVAVAAVAPDWLLHIPKDMPAWEGSSIDQSGLPFYLPQRHQSVLRYELHRHHWGCCCCLYCCSRSHWKS
jgi:hypothetical protein